MSLTNQQARKILLELYCANLDQSDTMFLVLNHARRSALWKACEVLKATDETPTIYEPDTVTKNGTALRPKSAPPKGKAE